jgi:hypothetical protein
MNVRRKLAQILVGASVGAVALVATSAAASAAPVNCATTAAVQNISYTATHPDGTVTLIPGTTVKSLDGNVGSGDVVTVTFSIAGGCTGVQVSIASYNSPTAEFDPSQTQTLFKSATGTFSAGGPYSLTATVPTTSSASTGGDPSQCSPQHDNSKGNGANQSPGPYDPTCTGAPSGNGKSTNNNSSKPCAGCVGNADSKNPPGQYPNGSDPNAGYECDRNQGVGQTNPAHTGCTAPAHFQLDFVIGAVLTTVGPPSSYYGPRLIDFANA